MAARISAEVDEVLAEMISRLILHVTAQLTSTVTCIFCCCCLELYSKFSNISIANSTDGSRLQPGSAGGGDLILRLEERLQLSMTSKINADGGNAGAFGGGGAGGSIIIEKCGRIVCFLFLCCSLVFRLFSFDLKSCAISFLI